MFFHLSMIAYIGLILHDTNRYSGPPSDHFNGKEFFNSPPYEKRHFWHLLTWQFTSNRKAWPREIPQHPAPPVEKVNDPDTVKITYVNHSTLLIQSAHVNILTDPVWSERVSPVSFLGPKRVRPPGIAFNDLPPIHAVLISHNHYDHMDLPTLKKLQNKYKPVFFVPLGNKSYLEKRGLMNVVEMDWWQSYSLDKATITFLPTQHWSARWLNDKFQTLWGSFGIEINNKKIYFVGDSGYGKFFKAIQAKWGNPDVALIPIGSYEPRWFMKWNHLNPQEAVHAFQDLQARYAIAIHFGTFQLSDEGIDEPSKDLQAALLASNVSSEQFMTLKEGFYFVLR